MYDTVAPLLAVRRSPTQLRAPPAATGLTTRKLEIAERQKERLGLWLSVWWQTICVA